MPKITVQDAQDRVAAAAEKVQSATHLLREARDELVRALIILGSPRRSDRARRPILLPLTLLGFISPALDVLMLLSPRLHTLSTTTPEKVEAEWRDVVEGIFGEEPR